VGAQPDVALIEVHSVITLASRGQIGEIQSLMDDDKDFQPEDLVEATLKNLKWQDKLYGIPVNRSTPILYYNKQRFVAAGLDPAKPPQTWSEFRRAAKMLTTDAESSYGFGANPSTWQFEALVWSAGGKLLSEDGKKAEFVAAGAGPLQLWADMIHRDKSARLAGREAFLSGQAAMFIESTALVANFEKSANLFEVGTAFVPHDEGQRPGVPTGGGVAIMAPKLPPARQRAAWQFLKWLTATEQTAELSRKTGYVPVRKSAVELLTKEGFYKEHPNFKTSVDQLQFAREMPTDPSWPGAMGTIHAALRQCLEQDKPAVDSLTTAANEVNRLLRMPVNKKQ
jgi:sn-glycerol 3-phosphate transport system substrate-binding protein